MAAKGPTPDFDQVTLRWWGVDLDGTPTSGRLELTYNTAGTLLDDDAVHPTLIYPTQLVQVLSTTTIQVDNGQGTLVDKTVGYASFLVPASDDPDIQGSGGTYTLVERLDNGRGQTRTFVASKDAPNGVIFLPRITSVTPVPGQAVSAVSVAEFTQVKAQMAQLQQQLLAGGGSSGGSGGSGGTFTGTVSWLSQVTDRPATYAPSAHQHPQTDIIGLDSVKAALDAVTLNTSNKADRDTGGKVPLSQLPFVIISRTADQGVPTAAECVALGYPDGAYIAVDPA